MSQKKLEERVTVLEEQVRRLLAGERPQPGPMDWLKTVDMFSGDEEMKKIDAAGAAWRERDRRKARAKKRRPKRVKS